MLLVIALSVLRLSSFYYSLVSSNLYLFFYFFCLFHWFYGLFVFFFLSGLLICLYVMFSVIYLYLDIFKEFLVPLIYPKKFSVVVVTLYINAVLVCTISQNMDLGPQSSVSWVIRIILVLKHAPLTTLNPVLKYLP